MYIWQETVEATVIGSKETQENVLIKAINNPRTPMHISITTTGLHSAY
jgi:hypothetical protein